jgi:hypothetical protein
MHFTVANRDRHYRFYVGDTSISGAIIEDHAEVATNDGTGWVQIWQGKPEVCYQVTVAVREALERGDDPAGMCFRWLDGRVKASHA